MEGQYLTYEEYQELGGTLQETPFNLLEFGARKEIDLRTHNRLKKLDVIPIEVKMCVFNMINKIELYAKNLSRENNISSESIDGYSISYANPQDVDQIIKSKNVDLDDTIITYLYGLTVDGEHAIYNGV